MSLDFQALFDDLTSLAAATGLFTSISGHEPANAPATGLTAALWLQTVGPTAKVSGMAATAARVEFRFRIYNPMVSGNFDAIDPAVGAAAAAMIGVLSADFTLGGTVFAVDLLGAWNGNPVTARADYLKQADGLYRFMDVTIPLVVDDVWTQVP